MEMWRRIQVMIRFITADKQRYVRRRRRRALLWDCLTDTGISFTINSFVTA